MVFLDIKSAFDRVWHPGLIFKLNKLGISNTLLRWFTSYLENRSQSVILKGAKSNSLHITSGVPQGSILGPLLFLVYINDFGLNLSSDSYLFADDSSLLYQYPSDQVNKALNVVNQDLRDILLWAKDWRITYNQSKTVVINFGSKSSLSKPVTYNI